MIWFDSSFLRLQELFKLLELHLSGFFFGFLRERGVLRFHKAPSTSSLVGQSNQTKFAGETPMSEIHPMEMVGFFVGKTIRFLG